MVLHHQEIQGMTTKREINNKIERPEILGMKLKKDMKEQTL
jgi:hypothetical protein